MEIAGRFRLVERKTPALCWRSEFDPRNRSSFKGKETTAREEFDSFRESGIDFYNRKPKTVMSDTALPILGLTKEVWVLDVESASDVDLKKRGQYIYWSDPSSRVLMTSVRQLGNPDAPTHLWDFEARQDQYPNWFQHKLAASPSEVMFAAANCEFDRQGLAAQGFPTPDKKWFDILVLAYFLAFAGPLDQVLKQVFPSTRKDPRGTRLINFFCSSERHAWYEEPEKWQEFRQYCIQDAEVETELLEWCLKHLNQPWFQSVTQQLFQQDLIYRRINRRGIPIDLDAVHGARAIRDAAAEGILAEMQRITGLENPNSRDQLLGWLHEHNYPGDDLTKESVHAALDTQNLDNTRNFLSKEVCKILQLRAELGKSSVKKFDALAYATFSRDNRFRGGWQFYGASRTGRVAGRKLNPGNQPRPQTKRPDVVAEFMQFGNMELLATLFPERPILDTLSSSIRATLKAPPGKLWCVADLTSIESVGVAWLAGCKTIMDIFHAGRDTYTTFAAKALRKPYDSVTDEERTNYKPVVLGGAYGLSARGLVRYAAGMNVDLSDTEAALQIAAFREEYHELVYYWHQLTAAAIKAVKTPHYPYHAYAVSGIDRTWQDGHRIMRTYHHANWPRVTFQYDGYDFLYCKLPSVRLLSYYKPEVDPYFKINMPDGHSFTKETVIYSGIDQKATGPFWQRINSYGPKWLENITQALCRDILWHGLIQAEEDGGLEIVGDVYDELLTLCDENDATALDRLISYMTSHPPWLTDDFFLGAKGYLARRYKKD